MNVTPKEAVAVHFPGGATQLFMDDPALFDDEQLRVGHAAVVQSAQDKANGCWLWLVLGGGAYLLSPWAAIPFGALTAHSIFASVTNSRRRVELEQEMKRRQIP